MGRLVNRMVCIVGDLMVLTLSLFVFFLFCFFLGAINCTYLVVLTCK